MIKHIVMWRLKKIEGKTKTVMSFCTSRFALFLETWMTRDAPDQVTIRAEI